MRGGTVLVGRKYRLVLTPEQRAMAEEYGNICRAVWNVGLEQRREYGPRGVWIGYLQQAREMAEAKADHPWMALAPAIRDISRSNGWGGNGAEPGCRNSGG
jgi:putative transposase